MKLSLRKVKSMQLQTQCKQLSCISHLVYVVMVVGSQYAMQILNSIVAHELCNIIIPDTLHKHAAESLYNYKHSLKWS